MFAKNVFIKTKMMTKVLEKETLDITGAIEALQITEKSIQQIRESDMQLSNLVQAAVSFASTFEVDANAEYRKFHRKRRMPRRLDENHNTTAELEMPLFYRKEFTAVLDVLLAQIHTKTENIQCAFKPLLEGLCPREIPTCMQIERSIQLNSHIQVYSMQKWKCSSHTFRSMLNTAIHMVISVTDMLPILHFAEVVLDYSPR